MVQPYKLTFLKLKPNDSLRATRHKREKEADICACIVENMIFWTVPTIQKILKIWRQWRMQTCSVKQCQHHLMGRSARHQYNLLRSSKPAYRKGALSNQCTEMAIYQHKSRNHYLLVNCNQQLQESSLEKIYMLGGSCTGPCKAAYFDLPGKKKKKTSS